MFDEYDYVQKEKKLAYKLVDWLEDFADQLDCPEPDWIENEREYFKRFGAWETQMKILKKLRYAIKAEKTKSEHSHYFVPRGDGFMVCECGLMKPSKHA
jgi:hypothetical protein